MPMLAPDDSIYLRQLFAERLADPIQIDLFTRPLPSLFIPGQEECRYCAETEELLREVAGLTDKIQLSVHSITSEPELARTMGIARVPAIVLRGHSAGRLRYFGIPAGYEFNTLVEDIVDLSTGHVTLSKQSQEALATLDQDLHIQVFVTPT